MDKEFLKNLANESVEKYENLKGFSTYIRYNKDCQNLLKNLTDFLPDTATMSERIYCFINDLTSVPLCPYCGRPRRYSGKISKGYNPTCGDSECQKAGYRSSVGKRTEEDIQTIIQKGKETYFKKTGYENSMQNPDCLKKRKEKCLKTYGVEHPSQIKETRDKTRKTIIDKFGSYKNLYEERTLPAIIEKYGSVENFKSSFAESKGNSRSKNDFDKLVQKLGDQDFEVLNKDDSYTWDISLKCEKCGTEFELSRETVNRRLRKNIRFCPKCDYKNLIYRSDLERDVFDKIKEFYSGTVLTNKYLNGMECDIIIPDKKIAVEVNGLYWHSELFKDSTYHQEKKKRVEQTGFNLIQIWEDDWFDPVKQSIIVSRLKAKLGCAERIYARKCEVVRYGKTDVKSLIRPFLDQNHLSGFVGGSDYWGLTYKGELVELVELGKSRKFISGTTQEIELLRLCTKNGFEIIGGFSKLISHILRKTDYEKIISYSDLDWCPINGSSYRKAGFKLESVTSPNYWWMDKNSHDPVRENRLKFTKQNLVKAGFNPDKTEIEIMHDRNFYRVYGSGNLKLKLEKCAKHETGTD